MLFVVPFGARTHVKRTRYRKLTKAPYLLRYVYHGRDYGQGAKRLQLTPFRRTCLDSNQETKNRDRTLLRLDVLGGPRPRPRAELDVPRRTSIRATTFPAPPQPGLCAGPRVTRWRTSRG